MEIAAAVFLGDGFLFYDAYFPLVEPHLVLAWVGDDAARFQYLGIHGDIVRFGHLLPERFFEDVEGKPPSDELFVFLPVFFLDFFDFVNQVAKRLGELVVLLAFGDLVQFLDLGFELADVAETSILGKGAESR